MPYPEKRRRVTAIAVVVLALMVAPVAVIASDAFTDVPESNVHHDDITWLADAGVTKGCNPPANSEYCPDDPVTRAQMASFLRRLAENKVVDAATAATAVKASDADTLGGANPTAYQTVVAGARCNVNASVTATSCGPNPDGSLPNESTVEILEFGFQAPSAGVVEISGHALGLAITWVALDETCVAYTGTNNALFAQAAGGLVLASEGYPSSATALVSVSGGNHTLRLCAVYPGTDDLGYLYTGNLSARWTAEGTVTELTEAAGTGTPLDIPLGD